MPALLPTSNPLRVLRGAQMTAVILGIAAGIRRKGGCFIEGSVMRVKKATTIYEQIDILEKTRISNPISVWLKVDSGMHRLGFQPHQVKAAYARLINHPKVRKPIHFSTHFSDADDKTSPKTTKQIAIFEAAVAGLGGTWSMANSAAILDWPKTRASWIRPGILLYGASPFSDRMGLDLGFEPVMTLTSRVIAIHELEEGETIGYGSTFCCPKKMRIGTVAIGYGDGYPRDTQDAPVLVDGIPTKTLGRVAMDMTSVDLSNVPMAKVGSNVTLWGQDLPIEGVAKHCSEIPYEMFCRLTSRVRYKFY